MLEVGLRATGLRTGRYTSPHLIAIEERIAVNGESIEADAFDRAATVVRDAASRLASPPSYFEATTALAFVAFRAAFVDVAVLEVGLGGRLDATNAADATLAVITNIGLDHQPYLGNTIGEIAAEKAGVIKRGAAVVAGRTRDDALAVLRAKALEAGADFLYAPTDVTAEASSNRYGSAVTLRTPSRDYGELLVALPGRHQVDNAITAVRALELARERGIANVDETAIRTALADVRWPGRLDWRTWRDHEILVDGAHNPAGAGALASFIAESLDARVPIVVGIMRDKEIAEMLNALAPVASAFICTAPANPRAATPIELSEIAARIAPDVECFTAATPEEALMIASQRDGPIVVAGSLFLAGEILAMVA